MVLKPAKLEEIALARGPDETPLLHLCEERYMLNKEGLEDFPTCEESSRSRLTNPNDPWRTFTRELVRAGENVSALNALGVSPLGVLMNFNEQGFTDMRKVLKTWLQDLKDAGVDLEEYGKRESACSRLYDIDLRRFIDMDEILYSDGTLISIS
jgi:hypothetical protein